MSRDNNEPNSLMVCMNVVNSLTHWILGAVAMIAIVFATIFPGSSHLLQHIYLCTIGYVLLIAQGILTFSPNNGWSQNMRYQDKKLIHWVIQVMGAVLAMTGSIIRSVNLTSNYTTPHGILGLIAMIFTGLSLIGGALGLYTKKTEITKLMHSCSGSIALVAAFITLCFGFDKTFFRVLLGDTVADLAIAFTVLGLIGTLCSAAMNNLKRITKNIY